MNTQFKKIFFGRIATAFLVATMLLSSVPAPAFAAVYAPGATLDPTCLPTDVNCGVTPPLSSSTTTPATASTFSGTSTTTPSTFYTATSTNFTAVNATTTSLTATIANIVTAIIDTLTARVATIYGLTVGTLTATSTAQFQAGLTVSGGSTINNGGGNLASNSAYGLSALSSNTTGFNNTANGSSALKFNTTGGSNSAFGSSALSSNTTGFNNTANGSSALSSNTTGGSNSAFGSNALNVNTTGSNNSALGNSALSLNTTGTSNSAFGSSALAANTNGVSNSAFGVSALTTNTTGGNNSAFGSTALLGNTTGGNNSAFGSIALTANTTGASNSAFGVSALATNTTGGSNSAFGSGALNANTTGTINAAVGANALLMNTTGSNNLAVGGSALILNTTGIQNTAVGVGSLFDLNITNGTGNNTALGYGTGRGIVTGINNTIIGANVTGLSSTLSNNIIIADGSGNQRINVDSSGNVGIGTSTPSQTLSVAGNILSTGSLAVNSATIGSLSGILFANAGSVTNFATSTATAGQVLGISGGNLAWLTQSGGSGATSTVNGVNGPTFTFSTGTTGTDFNIATSTGALTWNIPNASATARGLVSTTTQTFAGDKTFAGKLFLTQGTATSSLIGMTSGGTRMRLTSGTSDTQDNDQGASVDLQTVTAGGGLDFVAGRGGALNFWTSTSTQTAQSRATLDQNGLLSLNGGLKVGTLSGLLFGTAGNVSAVATSTLFIASNGNIGIGTTTPNNALSVNGAITLASTTPATTTSALYNQAGTLYWNGSAVGLGGMEGYAAQTVTTNTTLASWSGIVYVDASAGAVTITLPASASNANKAIRFYRTDSTTNTVKVQRAGSETFQQLGAAFTVTSLVLKSGQGQVVDVRSNGSNPDVINGAGIASIERLWLPSDAASAPTIWLKPDALLTAGALASWADSSGNSNTASQTTAGNRPVVALNALNGYSTVGFSSASAQYMSVPTINVGGLTTGSTFNVIQQPATPTTNSNIIWGDTLLNNGLNFIIGGSAADFTPTFLIDNLAWITNGTSALTAGAWGLSGATWTSAGVDYYTQGKTAEHITQAVSPSGTGNAMTLGARVSYGNYRNAPMAEVIMYGAVLTQSDMDKLAGYAAYKYGLQANLPAGHTYKTNPPIFTQSYTPLTVTATSLGVGTTTPNNTLSVQQLATGNVASFTNGTGTCTINPTTTALVCTSDATLKHDITALSDGTLDKVLALKPSTFVWNSDETSGLQYGFIAQDVQQIFPTLVATSTENGKLMLSQIGMMPFVIKSIQEQQLEIAGLTGATSLVFASTTDAILTATSTETIADIVSDPVGYISGKVASGFKIVRNIITERVVAVEGYFKRIFANELCLTDSSGTPVCVTGDNLKNIGGSTTTLTTSSTIPATSASAPVASEPAATSTVTGESATTQPESSTATSTPAGSQLDSTVTDSMASTTPPAGTSEPAADVSSAPDTTPLAPSGDVPVQ